MFSKKTLSFRGLSFTRCSQNLFLKINFLQESVQYVHMYSQYTILHSTHIQYSMYTSAVCTHVHYVHMYSMYVYTCMYCTVHRESTLRVAHQCTAPPVWLVPTCVYLIKFLIWNLSYSLCNEPSCTVLFLNLMYTMYARQLS